MSSFPSRRARLFDFVLLVCALFLILTTLAMLFYPGGTQKNPHSAGYSLAFNFFSDLGRARALGGAPNGVSSALFTGALTLAGVALATFFGAFATFFWAHIFAKVLSLIGAILGFIAGASFVGVALVSADRNSALHIWFVLSAFRAFLGATLPFALAILTQNSYPKLGAWIFLFFAGLLASYIALLYLGPTPQEPGGLSIQVVGQKIIVYAAVLGVGAQAFLARDFLRADEK